ncbi:hypothetical protein BN949_04167 [Agrobacterium tumefaciens]|nr:hypothetical protein BN949_04167 [Agrobacterium tumefaciens]
MLIEYANMVHYPHIRTVFPRYPVVRLTDNKVARIPFVRIRERSEGYLRWVFFRTDTNVRSRISVAWRKHYLAEMNLLRQSRAQMIEEFLPVLL